MRHTICICKWIGLGAALGCMSAGHALEADKVFEKLSPSVWVVNTFDAHEQRLGQGSAVVIAPGRLVTNCHVLEKASSMVVQRGNIAFGARLEYPDVDRDLCQLKVAEFSAPAVEIALVSGLKVGQRVYALGSPRGLELSLSDGLVSALRRSEDGNLERIQTTAPISPGSSGGGLFDDSGRLIGITTSGRRNAQNLNFAVPASWIAELPERGKAALARNELATKTKAEEASVYPRRMSAEEIAAHFSSEKQGRGRTRVSSHITFKINGNGSVEIFSNISPARGYGTLRFKTAEAQVCIDSWDRFMSNANDCFQMFQTGPSEFSLKSVSDNYYIDYKI